MKIRALLCPLFLLSLLSTSLFSESLRGVVAVDLLVTPSQPSAVDIELTLDEFAVLRLPEDRQFLEGVQIEIILSETLKRYADSFGIGLYYRVRPEPAKTLRSYTAERGLFAVLPHANRGYIRIPLAEGGDLSSSVPILSSDVITPEDFPVLLGIQPVSKGIPDSVLSRKFFLSVVPIIEPRGLLELDLQRPKGFEEDSVELLVDDQFAHIDEFPLILDAGTHRLDTRSDVFLPVSASFSVDPGQTTRLDVRLEPNVAIVTVESLAGATVYLDGNKVILAGNEKLLLTDGPHTVRFKIGEYSVSRKFSVNKGKNYRITLVFDVEIKED